MYSKQQQTTVATNTNQDFDDLMADLFVLVTHHSLTQCENALPKIVERIHTLTHHDDIECYPNQLKVLLKMQTLWRTKIFRTEVCRMKH